jgi:hypothetical protein
MKIRRASGSRSALSVAGPPIRSFRKNAVNRELAFPKIRIFAIVVFRPLGRAGAASQRWNGKPLANFRALPGKKFGIASKKFFAP